MSTNESLVFKPPPNTHTHTQSSGADTPSAPIITTKLFSVAVPELTLSSGCVSIHPKALSDRVYLFTHAFILVYSVTQMSCYVISLFYPQQVLTYNTIRYFVVVMYSNSVRHELNLAPPSV